MLLILQIPEKKVQISTKTAGQKIQEIENAKWFHHKQVLHSPFYSTLHDDEYSKHHNLIVESGVLCHLIGLLLQ